MGGFGVHADGREVSWINLPVRNLILAAVMDADDFSAWNGGVIGGCGRCLDGTIKTGAFRAGLELALRMLEANPRWRRRMKPNWSCGRSDREVALEVIPRLLAEIESVKDETLFVHDEFAICYDPQDLEEKFEPETAEEERDDGQLISVESIAISY